MNEPTLTQEDVAEAFANTEDLTTTVTKSKAQLAREAKEAAYEDDLLARVKASSPKWSKEP